ncbi:hypothetical protein [Flavobacterium luteum]|uniref:Uncharacterized protein n=1 Tax=Flavobacterium luteum TaxID=2026654 RepID=A0A7J5AKQ6_9FLAO|nr:hypothetical protein [Flavobacterium luteum]KAB1158187.1 hypothetical protein F6464_03645 [Flavobacterium luteum]
MDDSYLKYEQKAIKAKEKISVLEKELLEVRNKLNSDQFNINLMHELKRINIRMSKAIYELKHSQLVLEKPNSIL